MNSRTTIRLTPKTRKAKNRIKECGTDLWEIIKEDDSVICFNGEPGIFIAPICEWPERFSRWIKPKDDFDFLIDFC